jgi:hypothetical protein
MPGTPGEDRPQDKSTHEGKPVNEGKAKTRIPTAAEREANRLLYGTPEGRNPEVDPDKDRQEPVMEYVWVIQWTRGAEYRTSKIAAWREEFWEGGSVDALRLVEKARLLKYRESRKVRTDALVLQGRSR